MQKVTPLFINKHEQLLLVLNKKNHRGFFLVERDTVCIANYLLNQIICMS